MAERMKVRDAAEYAAVIVSGLSYGWGLSMAMACLFAFMARPKPTWRDIPLRDESFFGSWDIE